ncbi:MAG: hypothetical protein JXM73_08460 [Anaerolineae bacterium]|nr:hypothetical protein [Anaerolineae bacterium]
MPKGCPADRVCLPGIVGLWAVLCGVLAALRWPAQPADLVTLLFVVILVILGWGTVWHLTTATDWFGVVANGRPSQSASRRGLPYTQPGSPAGRLGQRIALVACWWRAAFGPSLGSLVMGLLAAAALIGASLLILPARLGPLHLAFGALVGLAVVWQRRGKCSPGWEALARVGLGWLAGYLAFGEMQWPSLALALCFALCAWGALRIGRGQQIAIAGLWLLNGSQVLGLVVMIAVNQPLAAGGMGLALFGQAALQLPLSQGGDPRSMIRRTWPWLMAAMAVAALAIR